MREILLEEGAGMVTVRPRRPRHVAALLRAALDAMPSEFWMLMGAVLPPLLVALCTGLI